LRIVAWSDASSASAGSGTAETEPAEVEPVRMERSTSAFSSVKPPTPQAASARRAASAAAFGQAEAKSRAGRLYRARSSRFNAAGSSESNICAVRDNRQISQASDGINKL